MVFYMVYNYITNPYYYLCKTHRKTQSRWRAKLTHHEFEEINKFIEAEKYLSIPDFLRKVVWDKIKPLRVLKWEMFLTTQFRKKF